MVKLDRDLFVSDCDNLEIWNVTSGGNMTSIPLDMYSIYLARINETLIGDIYSDALYSSQIILYDTTTGQMMGSLTDLIFTIM